MQLGRFIARNAVFLSLIIKSCKLSHPYIVALEAASASLGPSNSAKLVPPLSANLVLCTQLKKIVLGVPNTAAVHREQVLPLSLIFPALDYPRV